MRSLTAIAYMSTATAVFSDTMLETLLHEARTFNAKVLVTGVLCCRSDSFFQYLEGPHEGVKQVYQRVRASASHHHLVELFNAEIEQREFAEWHMGFASATSAVMLQLSQASWAASRLKLESSRTHKTDAILFLHSFLQAPR